MNILHETGFSDARDDNSQQELRVVHHAMAIFQYTIVIKKENGLLYPIASAQKEVSFHATYFTNCTCV